jgi:two-component system sensor histidine kinase FlrB
VEVWRDISERRAAEARLSESHRLASLGVLASGFSHELNTPLGTVLMCVEGILREAQGEGAASHIVENASIAREQILRCRGVTQHFLRISRGQSSATELVDVATSLEAAARLVEPSARAHAVHLDVQTPPVRLCVRADEAELQHVLVNLLLNAIQASAAGGRISARVVEGEPVCLRVTDSGCGIAPAHQARIFEPFFTLRKGGTGLGLYLSRDFVRRWGGDIRVSSTPGRGSTFEVVLPPATAIADDRRAS